MDNGIRSFPRLVHRARISSNTLARISPRICRDRGTQVGSNAVKQLYRSIPTIRWPEIRRYYIRTNLLHFTFHYFQHPFELGSMVGRERYRSDRNASPRFIGHRIFQIRVTVKRDTREVASSSSDRSDVGSSEVTFHSPNPLTSEKELPPDRVPLPFSLEKWNGFVPGYFSGRERKDKRET